MATSSEIEKLERKWKENPRGTVFAPYAEALRKHGQLDLAREVLKQGLEFHPDYVPGNIVLGRCCLDLGEDGAAEAAFTHALQLDPENVIALKALAEITERQGRLVESVSWLNQLVAVDPSNDEARDQLARVEQLRESASRAAVESVVQSAEPVASEPPAEPAAAPAGGARAASEAEIPTVPIREVRLPPQPEPVGDRSGLEAEETVLMMPAAPVLNASPPPVAPPPQPEAPAGFAPMEADLARAARDLEVEPLAGLAREEEFVPPPPPPAPALPVEAAGPGSAEVELAYRVEETEHLELTPAGSSEFEVLDSAQELDQLRAGTGEFQQPDAAAELSLEASGASEYQTPSGAEELLAKAAAMAEQPTETFAVPAEEPPVEDSAPERPSGLRFIFPDEEPPEPPRGRRVSAEVLAQDSERAEPPVAEPEPILTESMAEVLVRQGLHEEALSVYRQLLARSPGSDHLRGRIRELELVLSSAAAGRRPSYLAAASGGESVESFFRALVEAGPPGGDGPTEAVPVAASLPDPGAGAPTRPASDPLSLSAIFGDEPTGAPMPPAPGPAEEPPAPPADAFSFDQFFGGPGSTPPAPGQPSIRSGRPSAEEDLDQFQNWLKSLKK
ncbi:MAG TPA: tetratricopeptide repeat protein [Gemmatimonadales bacterium]|nr:tetratricopeptide repeat protein [Gemmatimonadales bacterium]